MKLAMFKNLCISVLTLFIAAAAANAQAVSDTVPAGNFYIKSVQTGEKGNEGFWDQPGKKSNYKKGDKIGIWSREYGTTDQMFQFEPAGDGWYFIKTHNGGGYIDVAGGKNANGVKIQVWEKNGSISQKFRLKHLGDGHYKIYTYWGRVICTQDTSAKKGTDVHTWDDHNRPSTQWYLFHLPGGGVDKWVPKPVQVPKISSRPDFMIQNKDKALKFSTRNRKDTFSGTAYIAYIDNMTTYIGISSAGSNPGLNRKIELKGSMMRINYNPKTGEYFDAENEQGSGLTGKPDSSNSMLSLNKMGEIMNFEVIAQSKSSVIPKDPDFFTKNRNKTFTYKSDTAFSGGSTGTATVKSIKGNEIILSVTSSRKDEQTGKMVTSTRDYKIYYMNGYYTNNSADYPMWGVAAELSTSISINGDQNVDTFTVK